MEEGKRSESAATYHVVNSFQMVEIPERLAIETILSRERWKEGRTRSTACVSLVRQSTAHERNPGRR